MKSGFEEKFMEYQSGLISLCLEAVGVPVDTVYAYASMEENRVMFNAIFEVSGFILQVSDLIQDLQRVIQFLSLGASDLQEMRLMCQEYGRKIPSQMKMYYDRTTGRYTAKYRYEPICTKETGVTPEQEFQKWVREVETGEDRAWMHFPNDRK